MAGVLIATIWSFQGRRPRCRQVNHGEPGILLDPRSLIVGADLSVAAERREYLHRYIDIDIDVDIDIDIDIDIYHIHF